MRSRLVPFVLAALLSPGIAVAEPAVADDAARAAPSNEAETLPGSQISTPSLSHDGQLGFAVAPGVGYRVIFPYEEDIDCGQSGGEAGGAKRVCTGRLPVFVDLQVSYGVATAWDLLADIRLGVEQDFTRTRQFAVAPGFRYWIDPKLRVKLFATLQVVIDDTKQRVGTVKDLDFGVRNSNGIMFEVMRNLGVYLQLGETLALRRWLRFEVDGAIGVQMRMP